ncbi:MAG: flagellar biosynthetic protein FliR [Rhodoferax sp.]|uniref:flagellar biosynthetic protein FliR n=1 Tax=Rhodoferax sp. TaxID=50421 RepID=UPI00181177C0|nr:flagellar biosynthetic protein FliR [Rhodoferax sp.]NMM15498.1 flagellar biosynthetic protein FliR [Rhodoferax sp.]NMM20306.1 flagellar biosynthetic protein FliR [Rhodoferax sp.]
MITLTESQLVAWLSPMLWPFLRVLAVFSAAPIFSSKAFPVRARIALAFFIAFAAQPSLQGQPVISINGPEALGAVIQQVGIGLAIGFTVRLVFAAVELAGEVVGFQMGLNFAAFFDPSLNTQSSAVARFFGHMAAFLFIVMNGHLMVMMAVIKSFEAFPVDQNFLDALQKMKLYSLGSDLFATGLWIALPMVGMLMFANLALGIISRVAPQMNIYSIGFPITLSVGLIGITATLPMLDQPLMALMERAMEIFSAK